MNISDAIERKNREEEFKEISVNEFFNTLQNSISPEDNPFRILMDLLDHGLRLYQTRNGYVGDNAHVENIKPAIIKAERAGTVSCPDALVDIRQMPGKYSREPLAEMILRFDNAREVASKLGITKMPWPGKDVHGNKFENAIREEEAEERLTEVDRLIANCPSGVQYKDLKAERLNLMDELAALRAGMKATVYIPYARAFNLLSDRLSASPEELAAWIWFGPQEGGIAAYMNANELSPPPRFHFDISDLDCVSSIQGAWLKAEDVDNFQPDYRFITGGELIKRWSGRPEIKLEAFIRAKISESRLLDIHPATGLTRWSEPENESFPPLESALFFLSDVKLVEKSHFGATLTDGTSSSVHDKKQAVPDTKLARDEKSRRAEKRRNELKIFMDLVYLAYADKGVDWARPDINGLHKPCRLHTEDLRMVFFDRCNRKKKNIKEIKNDTFNEDLNKIGIKGTSGRKNSNIKALRHTISEYERRNSVTEIR